MDEIRSGSLYGSLIPAPMNPCASCSKTLDGDLGCHCHLHSYSSDLVLGLHFEREARKKNGQLAIF
jgi:hypothetical protein